MTENKPKPRLTPAMQQYMHFKDQYKDAVLFFRMGDFYETFYEDAKICSRVLGISLTSRNSKSDNPIPLAGIPYHALGSYLGKLVKANYKVAICEQVEDPAQAKGVVKRDVVRLITPGTLTEENLLDEGKGNFLAAICFDRSLTGKHAKNQGNKEKAGLAWVEMSTGQFYAQYIEARYIIDELVRLRPAECLISDDTDACPKAFIDQLSDTVGAVTSKRPGWAFDISHGSDILKKHFSTASLAGFGFEHADASIAAAGVVLEYLNETQKVQLGHIAGLHKVQRENFLQLDQTTLRSLEVERTLRDNTTAGSFLDSINETATAMGTRKLRHWVCYPLNNLAQIQLRQDSIAELVQLDALRDQLRLTLKDVTDIERITARISTGRANPRDLLGLAQALRQLPAIRKVLNQCSGELLITLMNQCDTLDSLADAIEAAISADAPLSIRDGGIINKGFNAEIDRLRSLCQDGRTWLANYQQKLIEATGIPTLKAGYNKVFGYYIEVSHLHTAKVPLDFVRKQTLKNAERYITSELKEYETDALTAQHRCKQLEEQMFQEIRKQIAAETLHLQQVADAIAQIDILAALAHIARNRNYCRPVIHNDKDMTIIDGRHPVLDVTLGSGFVPNDVALGKSKNSNSGDLAIITGPNMAGKSTYIRQTALLVLMAHMGSFIPAKSAQIGLADRIFTRVGASDELNRGQSTFMVEMVETANIINNATDRSIVILDEVGRGTSTYDGLSLAWAITEHIATNIACRTLFATHYHEITELADILSNIVNYNVAVREWKDDVVFLHKIIEGRTDKSYGVHVAKLAGIPGNVIKRSKEILEELENNFAREAHRPQLGGRLEKANPTGQMLLFDNIEPDPILEKLRDIDLNNLTPMDAINLLHEIKSQLEAD
ncbi:MAG: DNA mismatch repair protein MutS [Phycisphaerae bacterium]|nr:DNA mismatch repair protein MutS [Phycisphaerae bacterium]